nr:MAG TPA: hypothetical protein [Caudoviricetes sp.]
MLWSFFAFKLISFIINLFFSLEQYKELKLLQ